MTGGALGSAFCARETAEQNERSMAQNKNRRARPDDIGNLLVRRLNRRGVVNAKAIRKWCSDPHRPRVMRSCSQGQRRSVDRGTCGPGVQPRKKLTPGRRRCQEKRKAPSGAPKSRGVPESRAVREWMVTLRVVNRN